MLAIICRLRNSLGGFSSSDRWQLHMMELRNQQAKALVKSGMVSGRMEGDCVSVCPYGLPTLLCFGCRAVRASAHWT